MTKLNNLKYHYNYAKQYGDTDIQVTYFTKITDYFAQELYGEFLNSPARDSEGREKIYLMGKMFDLLLVNIKSVMETGKLNKKQ